MARVALSNELVENGNIWFKHVMMPMLKNDRDSAHAYVWDYSDYLMLKTDDYQQLYTIMTDHIWDTNDEFNALFEKICKVVFSNNASSPSKIKFTPAELAAVVANICAKCELFWDDLSHTPEELKYFKKTYFGKALWEQERFLSQHATKKATPTSDTAPSASSTSSAQSSSTPRTPRQPKQPGQVKSPYRSRGPLSGSAYGLVGAPNQKQSAVGSQCYRVVDFGNANKNKECRAYIRPLDANFGHNGVNAVLIGTSHNFGYLDCYFDDIDNAMAFIAEAQKYYTAGTLQLKTVKPDPNGYFIFRTDYGKVGCRAADLNEDLSADETIETLAEEIENNLEDNFRKSFEDMSLDEACDAFDKFLG